MADIKIQKFTNVGGDNLIVLPNIQQGTNNILVKKYTEEITELKRTIKNESSGEEDVYIYPKVETPLMWGAGGYSDDEYTILNENTLKITFRNILDYYTNININIGYMSAEPNDIDLKTCSVGDQIAEICSTPIIIKEIGENYYILEQLNSTTGCSFYKFEPNPNIEYFTVSTNDVYCGVTGNNSNVLGYCSTVRGDKSYAFGEWNSITGNYSVNIGGHNTVSGSGNISLGQHNEVYGDGAVAIGTRILASGDGTFVAGKSVSAATSGMTVFGTYNLTTANAALVIGNGSNQSPSDALVLLKDGTLGVAGDIYVNGINKVVATTATPIANQVLTYNGSKIIWADAQGGGAYVPLSAFNAAIGTNNTAESSAFAQGINNIAESNGAAIGNSTTAYDNSFAQGSYCNATYSSFAQGANSTATSGSLAQGISCTASEYSLAQGKNTTATYHAASFGVQNNSNYNSLANGNQSTAQYESVANGNKAYAYNQSLAVGQNVHAYDRSIAVGTYCYADYSCFAQGYGNELAANKISANAYSFAHGYMGVTAGEYSLAQGNHSYAYNNSLAQGSKVSADRYSFAQGGNSYCIATLASIAQGQDNKSDTYSQALGNGNIASSYCFAAGQNNNSSAFSFAQGQYNTATSTGFAAGASNSAYNKAFTQGDNCTAKNYSIAQGEYCEAYDSAQAFGNHIKISAGMAIGNYNKTSANAAFVIGNGANNANRSDLFIISANGVASGSDFTTNGVSLSGMLALYNVLTARPLTGSYTLKCVDGVLTWESEVPANAVGINNEQVGVNNEGFSVGN